MVMYLDLLLRLSRPHLRAHWLARSKTLLINAVETVTHSSYDDKPTRHETMPLQTETKTSRGPAPSSPLHGPPDGREALSLPNRLADCEDETRRLQDLLSVLEDAFLSEVHGRPSEMATYVALARHMTCSLQALSDELHALRGRLGAR